ncbi:Chemotaxis protein methyltransferase CheR [Minicystis rosea]|nr:Chemotaxis protein methyltransferase CheR [Minicystis rosea]
MSRLTPAQLAEVRRLVAEHAGLEIPDERVGELAEIVRHGRGALGIEAYLKRLALGEGGRRELMRIAVALAVHETYFFRDRAQLDVLVDRVLPTIARAHGRRRLRVLSAGASTGAEAYTIAILLRERRPDLAHAIEIVGIDLSPTAIEAARRGRYPAWALRETAPEIARRYFRTRGRQHEICDDVRASVSFEVRNLVEPDPAFWAPASFDVILCRNVIMYLSRGPAQALVTRMERALAPGGSLFLGHAETLRAFDTGLALVCDGDAFRYQKPSPSEPAVAPRAPLPELVAPRISARGALLDLHEPMLASRVSLFEPPEPHIVATSPLLELPEPRVELPEPQLEPHEPLVELPEPLLDLPSPVREPPAPRPVIEVVEDAEPEDLIRRAVALVERGDLGRAEEACALAQGVDDLDPIPHYLRALCRERAGDLDGAARHAIAASYLDPTFALPCLHLARIARRAGDLRSAQRELRRALMLLAEEDEARLGLLGGGLDRRALLRLCSAELCSVGAR